jgi:hypothetical protein
MEGAELEARREAPVFPERGFSRSAAAAFAQCNFAKGVTGIPLGIYERPKELSTSL